MSVTAAELGAAWPRAAAALILTHVDPLNAALSEWGLGTPLQIAHFLAQTGWECDELEHLVEEWAAPGTHAAELQAQYEPPSATARILGNTQPGDGQRYLGRGPIQLTGRWSYGAASKALSDRGPTCLDLLADPNAAAAPEVGWRVAGWFWSSRGCGPLADADDIEGVTRRINGGLEGLAGREALLARAKEALGIRA